MDLWYYGLHLSVYYLFHSLLIVDAVKAFSYQYLLSRRYYRLVYNALFVVWTLLLGKHFLSLFQMDHFDWISWYTFFGAIIIAGGLGLLAASLRQYNLSEFVGTQDWRGEHDPRLDELNTAGLNHFIRHPLYLASLLVFWGACVLIPHQLVLMTAIISSLYLVVGIRLEEKKLVAHFGAAYREYQKRVPMIFPKLW